MKYHPNHYARALLEALNDSPGENWDRLVKNFAELIVRNGDLSAANKIIAEVEKLWVRQNGGRLVEIETARPIDSKLAGQIKKSLAPSDQAEVKINPQLIAGVRITADDMELDNSLAAKLNKIFA